MKNKILSTKIRGMPLSYVLLFTLINTIFLIYFGYIIIRVALFFLCVAILHFFGKLQFADVDPVPFTTGINYLFFGLPVAIQYAIWVCPAADTITGNLNQWTFVTLGSIIASVSITSIFGLSPVYFLIVMILLYNLIRFLITITIGEISGAIISTTTNAFIYVLIANMLKPIIEFGINIFN